MTDENPTGEEGPPPAEAGVGALDLAPAAHEVAEPVEQELALASSVDEEAAILPPVAPVVPEDVPEAASAPEGALEDKEAAKASSGQLDEVGASPGDVKATSEPEVVLDLPRGEPRGVRGRLRRVVLGAAIAVSGGLAVASRLRGVPDSPRELPDASSALALLEDASVDARASLPGPLEAPPPPSAPRVWRIAAMKEDTSVTYVEGMVGRRSLSVVLTHAGMPIREVHRVLKAFEGVKKLDRTHPKDVYAFALDRGTGKIVAFEYSTTVTDVWQARVENELLSARKLELHVDRRRIAVGLLVESDLRSAVAKAGLDEDVLKRLDDALDGHLQLPDLRPGTGLRLVMTELRVEGVFSRYAEVDAVAVHPPNPAAPVLRVYYWGGEGDGGARKAKHPSKAVGYYDAKGRQPFHGGWRSPVPGARISSRFNPRRMHPVLHVVMPHNGIDFAAPSGAPVYATSSGTVASAGNGGPCGNMVQIGHPSGLTTAYCHLSRFAGGLHPGQHVETRQLIGYVGQTGRVTGPHLHFALKRGSVFLDPMELKMDGVRVLPPGEREPFARSRAELDSALDAIVLPRASAPPPPPSPDEVIFDESEEDGGLDAAAP